MKTKLIMIATLLLSGIMLSCQSQSNQQQSQQEYADEGEPEPTDPYDENTQMWQYYVLTKEDKAEDPAYAYKHAGGLMYDGMTLTVDNYYVLYQDEADYARYARIFYLATALASRFANDADTYPSSQQWSDFTNNVLSACRFDPPLFNEIKDKKWREKAKQIWYDDLANRQIYYKDKKYRRQSFQIGNDRYSPTVSVAATYAENKFNLPEGILLIYAW